MVFILSASKPSIMEKLQIKDRWPEVKARIKSTYPDIADEDLNYEEGNEEELLDVLEGQTGKSREELVEWLNLLSHPSM
jgi:hypothetical protein